MATDDYMNDVFKACNFIRGTMDSRYYYETIVALAYVKLSAISNGHKAPTSLDELRESISAINDEDTAMFIGEVLLNRKQLETNRDFEPLVNALPVSVDALKEIILHASINSRGSFAEGTPETLSNLAVELLNIDKNDEVADFGTGTGTFLVKAAEKHPCKLYYACDVNTSAVGIARMRASLLDVETIVEQKDMFQVDRKFNKIFSNYPFALSSYGFLQEKSEALEEKGISVPKLRSNDWLFNLCLASCLKENGKAVGIMTAGSSFNIADRDVRKYFVEEGLIEAIIALPKDIFAPLTSISTRLIVISHDNKKVRMIDASEICEHGRRLCTFSDDNIKTIVSLLNTDSTNSKLVSIEELQNEDFNLDPSRYLNEEIKVRNGVSLEESTIRVTRGAGVKAAELEENISSEPTSYRYLILADIVDGQVQKSLPYLQDVPESQKKYCAKNGDLVLSKIGPNFKAAVVSANDNEDILCTGNLYIITVDTNKFLPEYVQMYLTSSNGQAQLNRKSVGTAMKSVSVKDLKQVKLPAIPLEEQAELVEKRDLLRKEIEYHKAAIEKAQKQIEDLLVEE